MERNNFADTGREQRGVTLEHLNRLQIFLDHSSIEIFINGGEEVFTCRYFPNLDDNKILLKAEKRTALDFRCWPINSEKSVVF